MSVEYEPDRVKRALEAFLEFGQSGMSAPEFLAQHEDLRDLLEPMFAENSGHSTEVTPPRATPRTETFTSVDLAGGAPRDVPALPNFEIERELGRGGMGVVYLARDLRLDRLVAIKALTPEIRSDAGRLQRMRREARALAALNHPGIATIYSREETDDGIYLILEYIEGRTLSWRIAAGLTLDETLRVAAQIAQALHAAHSRGIVHRDLKPPNVMLLDDDDRAKILDFGLARSYGNEDESERPVQLGVLTQDSQLVGSPVYMSPEQWQGAALDARTDIWSFGCVLFEALTGTLAFDGSSVAEILQSIISIEPEWSRLPVETPAAVVELLQSCLVKDPAARLSSLAEALPALGTQSGFLGTPVRAPVSALTTRFYPLRRQLAVGDQLQLLAVIQNRSKAPVEGRARVVGPGTQWRETDDWHSFAVEAQSTARVPLQLSARVAGRLETPQLELEVRGESTLHPADRPFVDVRDRPLPFVAGQTATLETLEWWLGEFEKRAGELCILSGQPGSGQGSVLDWLAVAARTKHCRPVRGYVLRGTGSTKLVRDVVSDLLGLVDAELSDSSLRETLQELLSDYLGPNSETAAYLASVCLGEASDVDAETRQYRWYRLLSAAAHTLPIVLLIDDLHEADQDTLSLLRGVLRMCADNRVPLVAVASATNVEGTTPNPLDALLAEDLHSLHLVEEDLERDHVAELIDHHYRGAAARDYFPRLPDRILEKTNGQPAFVREVVASLAGGAAETMLFQRSEAGNWEALSDVPYEKVIEQVPMKFSDVLRVRLDKLPDEIRAALEYAALLGFEFPADVLESLLDQDTVDHALDLLESQELIRPLDADLTRYAFATSLIPTIIREQVQKSGSRSAARKKSRVADAIVEQFGDNVDSGEWVGHRLYELGRPADALPYLQRSFYRRAASGQYSDAQSLAVTVDAISKELGTPLPDADEWLLQKARVLGALGRTLQAIEEATRAHEAAVAASETAQAARALLLLSEIELRRTNTVDATRHAEAAIALGEADLGSELWTQATHQLGLCYTRANRSEEAQPLFERNLAWHRENGDKTGELRSINSLGMIHWHAQRLNEARTCFEEQMKLCEQLDNLDHRTISLVWIANVNFADGRLEEAREMYLEAVEAYRKLQKSRGLQTTYSNLAQVERLLGRIDTGVYAASRAVEISREMADKAGEAKNRIQHAEFLMLLHRYEPARDEIQRALEVASEIQQETLQFHAAGLLTEIQTILGEEVASDAKSILAGNTTDMLSRGWCLLAKLLTHHSEEKLEASAPLVSDTRECLDTLEGPDSLLLRLKLILAVGRALPDNAAVEWLRSFVDEAGEYPPGLEIEELHAEIARLAGPDEELARPAREQAEKALRIRTSRILDEEIREQLLESARQRL